MEFIQRNQRTLLIVLVVAVVLYFACNQGLLNCAIGGSEGYQANHTLGGRGGLGRGLTAERLVPACYRNQENHYLK